jgi:hypothetical protein
MLPSQERDIAHLAGRQRFAIVHRLSPLGGVRSI